MSQPVPPSPAPPSPAPNPSAVPVVRFTLDSYLARIDFFDPSTNNALNPTTLLALCAAIEQASKHPDCRVIMLAAGGDTFCSGMDFKFVADLKGDPPTELIGLYQRLLGMILHAPQPVIVKVDGSVKAGGMGVVAAADVVLATERSRFVLSETVFGLVPFNVLPFLLRRVPLAKAQYLILTAQEIDAAEGRNIGLVDVISADAAAQDKSVVEHMKRFLRASPTALANTKQFTSQLAELAFPDACMAAQGALAMWFRHPENLSVLREFQDGMAPPWFAKYRPTKG